MARLVRRSLSRRLAAGAVASALAASAAFSGDARAQAVVPAPAPVVYGGSNGTVPSTVPAYPVAATRPTYPANQAPVATQPTYPSPGPAPYQAHPATVPAQNGGAYALPTGAGPSAPAPAPMPQQGYAAQPTPVMAPVAAAPAAGTFITSIPAQAAASAAAPVSVADTNSRKGVVLVEKNGQTLALGAVLGGDGRMITALSAIGTIDSVDVRYADGSVQKARVGHRDPVWDLALLVPATGKWKEGLRASDAPAGAPLSTYVPARPKALLVPVTVRGRSEARAKGGEPMPDSMDIEVKAQNVWSGAPLVDEAGAVVGLLVRACRLNERGACMPTLVGAPVAALRNFISHTPATAVTPAPFLGIQGVPETEGTVRGVRVVAVAPNSPAEKGELRAKTDVIVAVDAQPVDSPEKLADCIGKRSIGEAVKLLVFGGDKFREVAVVLKPAP